jgi:hypothetical protein
MTDFELEQHISDLGRLIEKAFAEGDRAAAVAWSNARTAAIKARSPEQVARMEQDYFGECGERDRVALEGRG